jgi:membrane protein DedA with SNARE-associated domain
MEATYGLAAIFVVLLVKEIGVPVPIPSDILMIGAGTQAALGEYGLGALAVAVVVAVAAGVTLQFLLFRSFGRAVLERTGARLGLSSTRRAAVEARLRAGGARAVFVGLNVPGARAAVVAVAGLAALPLASFAPAAIAGTLVFHGWHVALGYLVGPSAVALLAAAGVPLLIGLVALAALGAAAWLIRRRDSPRAWTEAACPACLASAVVFPESVW